MPMQILGPICAAFPTPFHRHPATLGASHPSPARSSTPHFAECQHASGVVRVIPYALANAFLGQEDADLAAMFPPGTKMCRLGREMAVKAIGVDYDYAPGKEFKKENTRYILYAFDQ